jgi:hypothetical protein
VRQALVAGQRVMELLAGDAVRDRGHRIEPFVRLAAMGAALWAIGEVETDLAYRGTAPRAKQEVAVQRGQLGDRRGADLYAVISSGGRNTYAEPAGAGFSPRSCESCDDCQVASDRQVPPGRQVH